MPAVQPRRTVYFDYNATTPVDPAVVEAMEGFWAAEFGNPSSPHEKAQTPALAMDRARGCVASLIGAKPRDVIFTSGGTESNNSIVRAFAPARARNEIVVSGIEHASVLSAARAMEKFGFVVREIPVRQDGRLDLAEIRQQVSHRAALVCVMLANNETGGLLDVSSAAEIARDRGAWFHSDAVQALGKVKFDVSTLGADSVSISAHKIYGPKGVGALWIRPTADFSPLLVGGDQEFGRRAGTENVPGIVGMGAAAELAARRLPHFADQVGALRDEFEKRLRAEWPELKIAAADAPRLPNTSQLLIRGLETDALIARLDLDGLLCSSGSACASGSHEPSHVLRAMGLPAGRGWGVLRVSLGWGTSASDVELLVNRILHHVRYLSVSIR